MDFASTFSDILIWDYKNDLHPVSSLAMIALGFHSKVVHIYAKSIIILQWKNKLTTEQDCFRNIFDVHFSSF